MLAYMYNHMSWGWGVLMMLGWVVLLALIVAVAVSLARDRRSESARELLDRRLAAGEIGTAEYQRARDAMAGDAGEPPVAGPPAPV